MATDTKSEGAGRNSGRGGHRLSAAFDAVNSLPALSETVARVKRLTSKGGVTVGELSDLIESDTAITVAVMRAANNGGGARGRVSNVPDAVELLKPERVQSLAGRLDTYELFRSVGSWKLLPERARRHAVATRYAAERIAEISDVAGRDELATTAMLHDIGQLVLARLYPGYEEILEDGRLTPEERIHRERRELGIDHTLVGGVLARRWGLPPRIASAIERHHSEEATGLAAGVRLGDLVVHQSQGDVVSASALEAMAEVCGLGPDRLRQIVYEFPHAQRTRQVRREPCPLSRRESDALRGLAEGKVYKQIAGEMGLSASTVRTHLHNVYRKIGAADRAQAVLVARDRGWI
jgi:putative nucleotidyltransferase with HDIG domain